MLPYIILVPYIVTDGHLICLRVCCIVVTHCRESKHVLRWRDVRVWFDENRSAGSKVEMTRAHTTALRVYMLFLLEYEFTRNNIKIQVPTSQGTRYVPIIRIRLLMLLGK